MVVLTLVTSRRLILMIFCLSLIASGSALIHNNMQALVSENTLESITKQLDVLTIAPLTIGPTQDDIYMANTDSNSVSVIDPGTNTVIKNITVGKGPSSIPLFEVDDTI
jgi:YVTN family beta-propeller protein